MPDETGGAQRLGPLPMRVADGTEEGEAGLPKPPIAYVAELMERAHILQHTLDQDVKELHEDEAMHRQRIEDMQEELLAETKRARGEVEDFKERAYSIARNKNKVQLLEQGLNNSFITITETQTYDDVLEELEDELKAASGITGAIHLGRIGELLKQATLVVDRMEVEAEAHTDRQVEHIQASREAETREAAASFEIGTTILNRDIAILDDNLPTSARDWNDETWETWIGPTPGCDVLRFGTFDGDELHDDIPFLVHFPFDRSWIIETRERPDEARSGILAILVRLLATMPSNAVRFTIVDPKGRGSTVQPLLPLLEFNPELLDGGVLSAPDEIDDRFTELLHHIEHVGNQHLTLEHHTLEECNDAAGEIIEPYRVVVVLDFPGNLTDNAMRSLATIGDAGPRAGVFAMILRDPLSTYADYQAPLPTQARLLNCSLQGYNISVPRAGGWIARLDALPDDERGQEIVQRIVSATGSEAVRTRDSALEFGKLYDLVNRADRGAEGQGPLPELSTPIDTGDPTTWWTGSSVNGVSVPLARFPRSDTIATFHAGPKDAGLLITGQAGSGKSNVLHAIITGLSMLYPPTELELTLVGFAGSRDLSSYGEGRLPHAKVVATEADRELGWTILKDLTQELARRLTLLHDTVGERAGYSAYRVFEGAEPLPRSILVMDHFTELISGDDATATNAREALEYLIRLGPAAGMHLLLVAPADARLLTSPTLPLLANRLMLQMPKGHAQLIIGDAAKTIAEFTDPGEALLGTAYDDPSHVRYLRIVQVEPSEHLIALRDLERLTTDRGIDKAAPQVYDGAAVPQLEARDPMQLIGEGAKQGDRRMPRLWLGDPITVGPPVEAMLRRQDGANLMILTAEEALGQSMLLSSIVSSLLMHGDNLGVLAIDFMPADSGFHEAADALATGPWTVQLTRRRNMSKVLDIIHRVVQDRLATDDARAKPVLFVMNGLGRARDLDVSPSGEPEHDELHMMEIISTILRDGPEVGVHSIAWCDSLASLNRRLPRSSQREFALRVAGSMSAEDSLAFLDSEAAAALQPNEALLLDDDSGDLQRLRPFAMPPVEWLQNLGQLAKHAG